MQVLRNNLFRPWFVGEKDWGFEIIDGEFSGVTVQIERVEFSKTDEGRVDLEYHIINKPQEMELTQDNKMFAAVVEIIINDILTEAVNSYEQTRSNDSTKSDQ